MEPQFWFIASTIVHKIEIFSNDEDDLKTLSCGICNRIMIDASQITCGCKFCRKCIQKHLNNGGRNCPVKFNVNCLNVSLYDKDDFHAEKDANKKIRRIILKCPIQDCDMESELEVLVDHWLKDHKDIIDDAYSMHTEEEENIIQIHEQNQIEEEPNSDVITNENTQYDRIENEYIRNGRSNGYEHGVTTDKEVAIIEHTHDYVSEGTIENLNNKIIALKKKQTKLKRTIVEMKERIESLEQDKRKTICNVDRVLSTVTQLKSQLDDDKYVSYIWTVNEFSKHKIDDACLYSEPFFVFRNGYKMRLVMYPNGAFKENNFVSIYFEIVRGEFDPLLKWPFCCNVTLTLLSYNGDDSHSHTVFYLHHRERRYVYQRPNTEANIGLGASQFIEYARIIDSSKPLLYNDSLSLMCSLADAPLSLAWVE